MKTKKIKQLMERGLSHKLLLTMNEGQINQLHKMMVGEQVKGAVVVKKGTDPDP
jgi:predicted transglutaminase-like cysteine proteinase